MARFEVALRSEIAFKTWTSPPKGELLGRPGRSRSTSVGTNLSGTPRPSETEPDMARVSRVSMSPARSTVVGERVQRLLPLSRSSTTRRSRPSFMAGTGDRPDVSQRSFGCHTQASVGSLHTAPAVVAVGDDPHLRLALGLYREGLNAGSPFYRFLAFWNALDPVFPGTKKQRNDFLREEVEPVSPCHRARPSEASDYAEHRSRSACRPYPSHRRRGSAAQHRSGGDRDALDAGAYTPPSGRAVIPATQFLPGQSTESPSSWLASFREGVFSSSAQSARRRAARERQLN
jgi:Methylamine utilization protein MauJ